MATSTDAPRGYAAAVAAGDARGPAPVSAASAAAAGSAAGGAASPASPGVAAPAFRTASLWVGELSPEVSESHLYHIFSAIAPVASIRVCRDQVTRRSLGYAYVNFQTPDQAATAMKAMNYEEINGKRCRIMWSQRDPSKRKSATGNIFIKNLAPEVDTRALYDTFSMFGPVLSCKIATDPITNVSKCYGYVQFEQDDVAERAISKVNGKEILGRAVVVERYKRRHERKTNDTWTNCYVKNIPRTWTEEQLRELFEPFGKVTSVALMTNPTTGASKGFGFVNFEDMDAAEAAVDKLNGQVVATDDGEETKAEEELTEEERKLREESRKLYVGRAQSKSERRRMLALKYKQESRPGRAQGTNLFVKNLADDVTDDDMVSLFSPFGTITSHKVMHNPDGTSRCFGFVCFSTAEEATRAINEVNKQIWHGRPLYVALAQRKDVRERQLKEELEARMQQAGSMHRLAMPVSPYGVPMMPGQMPPGGFAPGMGYPAPGMYPQPMGAGPMMGAPPAGGMMGPGGPGGPGGRGSGSARRGRRGGGGGGGGGGGRGGFYNGGSGSPRAPPSGSGMPQHGGGMHGGAAYPPVDTRGAAPAVAASPAPAQQSWTEALATASAEERKNILGDQLFPLIAQRDEARAGKITGMILEMDASELINLIETPAQLDAKVEEAQQVLDKHAAASAAAGGQ